MRETPMHEGQRWLSQAQSDLKWASHLHDHGGYYISCFLCQQSAEKALKALLYAGGDDLVLGHSVRQLSVRASKQWQQLADKTNDWAILDSFYIPTRYPNGLPDDIPANVYNEESSQQALRLARDVVETVGSVMGLIRMDD